MAPLCILSVFFTQNAASRTLQATTLPNIAFRRINPFLFMAGLFTYPRPPIHTVVEGQTGLLAQLNSQILFPEPVIYSFISHFAFSHIKTHFIQMRPVCQSDPVNCQFAHHPQKFNICFQAPSCLPAEHPQNHFQAGEPTSSKITMLDSSSIYCAEYQHCYSCVI